MKNRNVADDAPENVDKLFAIVGIGASAGGIEAVKELLTNLSPNTGLAYVYIQHLDRDHESHLVDILSRSTTMKVLLAKHLTPVLPNHLYVIPPDKHLRVINGQLRISQRPPKPVVNMPVNEFFLSLAETQRDMCIGIILSGTGNDGALGLKAIRLAGGLTYAQDETAQYESMPRAAIAEGAAEIIMSPKEIAKELETLSTSPAIFTYQEDDEAEITPAEEEAKMDASEEELKVLFNQLRNSTNVDFTHYKRNTIKRRILRRMHLCKAKTLTDYLSYVKRNSSEINNLYNDLLINVTHFFRDPAASEYLKNELLPQLLKDRSPQDLLRIWIPACSTGEEPYSLAMIVYEVLGESKVNAPVSIFATDLSHKAIAKARVGMYSPNDVLMVSPERLERFFTKIDGHYRIIKPIRDLCVFAPHNIFKDPPFSRVDLISCCNLLIYLDQVLQKKVLSNFHYSLKNEGYLVLGESETIGSSMQLFKQVEKKLKVYSKKADIPAKAMFDAKYHLRELQKLEGKQRSPQILTRPLAVGTTSSIEKAVADILLSNYAPAAVVVNYDLNIIQFKGSTGLYLEPQPGQASLNLMKMAKAGLGFELKNAALKVIKTGEPVKKEGFEVLNKGLAHHVSFEITLLDLPTPEPLLLIVFEETKASSTVNVKLSNSRDRRVKQLENELIALREDMRSVIEEQEAANEELQSANEEIVSSNEELQSINEELETSKEELESSNEELMTINQELQATNMQLSEAQDYTEAVIATIRESVIILDSALLVKSANTAFYKTYRLRPDETEGVLIYELANKDWAIPHLKHLLENLIPRNSYFHGFELTHKFTSVGEKVLLINGKKIMQKIHLQEVILLAIEDITEHRQAEHLLEEREAWLRNMSDNVPVMIWVAGADKNFTYLNKTWLAFTGRTLAQETGIGWTEGVYKEDLERCLTTYHEAFDEKKPFRIEYRMKRHDGEYRWILNKAVPTFDSENNFSGYTGSCTEIHDERLLNQELEKRVEQRTGELQQGNENL